MEKATIKATKDKGRGVYATELIKAGTVILEEEPLVSCQFSWNSSFGYLACEYCLAPLETAETNVQRLLKDVSVALPYPECCPVQGNLVNHTRCEQCGVMYCSEKCASTAKQLYHSAICLGTDVSNSNHPLNVLKDFWQKMHYPPETSGIMLFVKIIAMVRQSNDAEGLLRQLHDFTHTAVNEDLMIFHKMLGEKYCDQIEQLYKHFSEALSISTDEKTSWLTEKAFRNLLALVGTNGQGIGTSSYGEWVKNVGELELSDDARSAVDLLIDDVYSKLDQVVGTFLNNEGSSLYVNQSKVNHSCAPNAEVKFPHSNHVLALTACRDILPDEEICIAYLDECALERSRYSRQKILSENYLFHCQCEKCESQINDPNETSEDEDDEDMDDSD